MSRTRRTFIGATAGAAALWGAAKERLSPLDGVKREKIKITDLKVISLGYRLKPEEEWPDGDQNFIIWKTESVIIEVKTDAGITGLGACSRYNGPAQMKEYTEKTIKPLMVGRNPFDVEWLAGGMCGPGARAAWAGVDTALWDIIARSKGVPLYKLLAIDCEPVTRLRTYASAGEFTWRKNSRLVGPENLIKEAVRFKEAGYTAYKFRPGGGFGKLGIKIQDYVPYLRRMREAVGPKFELIQEANTRWSLEQCLEICPVIEELKFLWFEEPTKRSTELYLRIKQALPTVKVSGGEGRRNRGELAEWVDTGAYDIVQHASRRCGDDGGVAHGADGAHAGEAVVRAQLAGRAGDDARTRT